MGVLLSLEQSESTKTMLSIFVSKSNTAAQAAPKSQLDAFKKDETVVLDKSVMNDLKGGKQTAKTFFDVFSWNTSCGGSVPQ